MLIQNNRFDGWTQHFNVHALFKRCLWRVCKNADEFILTTEQQSHVCFWISDRIVSGIIIKRKRFYFFSDGQPLPPKYYSPTKKNHTLLNWSSSIWLQSPKYVSIHELLLFWTSATNKFVRTGINNFAIFVIRTNESACNVLIFEWHCCAIVVVIIDLRFIDEYESKHTQWADAERTLARSCIKFEWKCASAHVYPFEQ